MTVLVGVLCTDGVVIGADSAMTHAAGVQPVMKVTGGVKLETPFNRFITATTGPVGLGQRFHQELHDLLQEPKELDKWSNQKPPVEFATKLAQVTIDNLKKTVSPHQQHPQIGWEFGALLGFASKKYGPQLVEFDQL